jgi:predicted nucleic-acid-binding protein
VIGLDTNVVVRYIMQDDRTQALLATELIENLSDEEPGFLSLVVIVESVWVLESCYNLDRTQIAQLCFGLLQAAELIVDHSAIVNQATRQYATNKLDFADCLIEKLCAHAGCERVVTFDKKAARKGGMTLLV